MKIKTNSPPKSNDHDMTTSLGVIYRVIERGFDLGSGYTIHRYFNCRFEAEEWKDSNCNKNYLDVDSVPAIKFNGKYYLLQSLTPIAVDIPINQ